MRNFRKILIANRGEIAVRIARTARAQGYRTVAVFSDADADSLHVAVCDEAVRIGPAPAGESYLSIDAILGAARASGAEAVHPGYGFLSENAAFADALATAGLILIGPPAEAIRLMGDKRRAKIAMIAAGVPCVPGYEGDDQSHDRLLREAERVGLPLMVKAAAGGGGRGMRLVTDPLLVSDAIEAARREAQSAFGDGDLILERAIVDARHVEIQVFGDEHGTVLHLGERDCSIQRRHQKVIEESPSPVVDAQLRARMGAAAVQAARACGYVGAGTVEFLLDASGDFYFLEMNTRLQVEHPVTELVTGRDLVELQLRVAAGEPLGFSQDDVSLTGHAIEARLYAEDPRQGFLPQTGVVRRWRLPTRDGLRIDHGVREGQEVSPFYDPMLAKVCAWGRTRADAARRLAAGLEDVELMGLRTNQEFLVALLRNSAFLAGSATTGFIGSEMHGHPSLAEEAATPLALALASLAVRAGISAGVARPQEVWRPLTLGVGDARQPVRVREAGGSTFDVAVGDEVLTLRLLAITDDRMRYEYGGVVRTARLLRVENRIHLDLGDGVREFEDLTLAPPAARQAEGGGEVLAPMDGAVVALRCTPGDEVQAGQVLLVIEAMKMQHQLSARIDGVVDAIDAGTGDQVKRGQRLALVRAS